MYAFFTGIILLGNVYIADNMHNCIRKVTVSTGIISTYAGIGSSSFSGDGGQASSSSLYTPTGVVLDAAGTRFACTANFHVLTYILPARQFVHR